MRGLLGERLWSFEPRDKSDLEERVAHWIASQESTSWIASTVGLSMTLVAMVLFALSR